MECLPWIDSKRISLKGKENTGGPSRRFMPDIPDIDFTNDWITSRRGKKNKVSEYRPYAFSSEQECSADGSVRDVLTVFLTNSECPFKCLMCDLWKNTLDHPVSKGSIIRQIKYALKNSYDSHIIKLYNSGNFFDTNAIPVEDYAGIADILSGFR